LSSQPVLVSSQVPSAPTAISFNARVIASPSCCSLVV
jgi:hypothetical protein